MQRKEPLENKGVAGIDSLPRKKHFDTSANQRHISIIAPIVTRPWPRLSGSPRDRKPKNSDQNYEIAAKVHLISVGQCAP
jgi:hypothetical protein